MHDSRYPWFIFDLVLFWIISAVVIFILKPSVFLINFPSPFQWFILGLAAYRGANIISTERITQPFRAPFVKVRYNQNGDRTEEPLDHGFKGSIGSLIYCASCTGTWLAAILTYGFFLFPGPTWVIAILLSLTAFERFALVLYFALKKLGS